VHEKVGISEWKLQLGEIANVCLIVNKLGVFATCGSLPIATMPLKFLKYRYHDLISLSTKIQGCETLATFDKYHPNPNCLNL